ncbi:MAG: hypothetical protein ACRC6K_03085 [Fusobacteriaceae bacterium]
MEKINILYIDDCLDMSLVDYLSEEYINKTIIKNYDEISFETDDNYEKLLNNEKVKIANIIIIDSSLFEENNANNMFTGEEFKIIFKNYFPYAEVIIVSQNTENKIDYGIIEKFKHSKEIKKPKEYYDDKLKLLLDEYIKKILELRNILKKMKKNESLSKILIDRIGNSVNGIIEYQDMTSKDIDDLIKSFKEVERILKCQD